MTAHSKPREDIACVGCALPAGLATTKARPLGRVTGKLTPDMLSDLQMRSSTPTEGIILPCRAVATSTISSCLDTHFRGLYRAELDCIFLLSLEQWSWP